MTDSAYIPVANPDVGMVVGVGVKHANISATVIRCGCGDPLAHASQGLPCSQPRRVDDLGIVAEYQHRPTGLKGVVMKFKKRIS